jgi:hypothetical protein
MMHENLEKQLADLHQKEAALVSMFKKLFSFIADDEAK